MSGPFILYINIYYIFTKTTNVGYPTGNEKGTYLALEISGVDIYVCQVKLKGEGGKLAINQYQYEIPDDLSTGNDISILIDYVADCVSDFQRRVSGSPSSTTDTTPQTVSAQHHQQPSPPDQTVYSMAISLGFAVRQTGLDRGTFIALEHGFEFPNVIGRDVVDLFQSRFQAKGLNVRIVAIANGKFPCPEGLQKKDRTLLYTHVRGVE